MYTKFPNIVISRSLLLPILLVLVVGCSTQQDTPDQSESISVAAEGLSRPEFAEQWREADTKARLELADTSMLYQYYQGEGKSAVMEELGEPDEQGVDNFGEDIARYNLGKAPEDLGDYMMHVTFVFEQDSVIRVTGNFVSQ